MVWDDRYDGIMAEIEREDGLAAKYMEQYWETGSPSTEATARRHGMIADMLRKGVEADRHAQRRSALACRVMEIETKDLLKCGQQVKRLQQGIADGDF